MACSIDKTLQLQLIGLVAKELSELAKVPDTQLNVEEYIKNFYDRSIKRGLSAEKSAEYAQFIPTAIRKSVSLGDGSIMDIVDTKALRTIEKTFSKLEDALNFLSPALDSQTIQDTQDSIQNQEEQPTQVEPADPQTLETAAKEAVEFVFKPSNGMSVTGQQGIFKDGAWSNIKNPEEEFYYGFYPIFADALRAQGGTAADITINGHKGFKLNIVRKTKIDIEDAKPQEQRLVAGEQTNKNGQPISAEEGQALYNNGVGAVISDNAGNILYFDESYNVVPKGEGKPIYHNLRVVRKDGDVYAANAEYGGTSLQSIAEMAKSENISVERAEVLRQSQLKAVYAIREYLAQDSENTILTDISGVSKGVLDIRLGTDTPSSSIDWAGSDVQFTPKIATLTDPGTTKAMSGMFIDVPGQRAIPVQENNFTNDDAIKITDLLFDPITYEKRGKQVAVPGAVKERLIKSFVYDHRDSIQVMNKKGEYMVFFKGQKINLKDPAAIEKAKADIQAHLTTKYTSKKGVTSSKYNINDGRYKFDNSFIGKSFDTFSIADGVLTITPMDYYEFVKQNSALKIVPNEENKIVLLNGYFTFSLPAESKAKLRPEVKATEETPSGETGDISATQEKITPVEQVAQAKKRMDRGKLYRDRVLPMNSTPEAINAAKAWFNNSPLANHIGYQEAFNVVNSNAWAEFSNGAIKLYAGADHTALYHEAWHAFSQHFMSKEQKRDLYGEILTTKEGSKAVEQWATKKGVHRRELSPYEEALAVEELIAEDFRKYMLSGGTKVLDKRPKRNTLFRRIMNFFKEVFGAFFMGAMVQSPRTYKLTELYEQLRVGNLNEYTPSEKNMMFTKGPLYKTIEPVEGQISNINDQDAMLLVESIDSYISEYIDEQNAIEGNTMFTSAVFTVPELVLPELFDVSRDKFIERKNEFQAEADASEGLIKEQAQKKANLLQDALNNWGELSGKTGLTAFYLEKSPFLSAQTKNIDKSVFEKTQSDVNATRFDKSGNDLSMMDLASNQVLHLVKSLREFDKNKEIVKNSLGFSKLTDYRITWRQLVNILTDNNNSPATIKAALEKAAPTSPWINDLLDKLGAIDSVDASTFDLWTNFWQAFYLANWGLYQVSVNELSEKRDVNGEITDHAEWEVLVGYASAVFRQVERDFRSFFKGAQPDGSFIVDTRKKGNVLDYKVLDKYRGNLDGREFEFLTDIGFPLTDVKAIREGLKDVRVDYLFDKLDKLSKIEQPIHDVIEILKNPFKIEAQVQQGDVMFDSVVMDLPSETSNINKILNLQARHSGLYANTAVSTADGNTKYEQTQMSTLGVMQQAINSVDSFQDLIAIPHMAHLKYENNPAVRASIWLKSLFEFNEATQTFGKKRPGVKLMVDDLSGTQTIVDGSYANYNYSSATAKSDKYTRLLQDIYSSILGGRFSTMVHADKSTTLAIRVSEIDSGTQSSIKTLYVDNADFLREGAQTNMAIENAYELLLPYVEAELTRIAKVEAADGSLPNIPGYTIKNSKGVLRGADFSIFDDVFKDIQTDIKAAGSVDNISAELHDTMLSKLVEYFEWSTANTKESLGRMMFVDPTIKKLIQEQVGEKLDTSVIQDLILSSYTVNSFIHHIESLTVIYGDLAQYDMLKEEFHKRNAGIASTGRMFRTDRQAIDYVNNVLGRPYREKVLGDKGEAFNGTANTAVLEEVTLPSQMVPEYTEALVAHYKSRGMSEKAAKAKADKILEPYTKMDEGDAQGWISFDSYRILAKLEGRWSRAQEALFMKLVTDPSGVNLNDITEYFPPRKYQYFGPLATQNVSATAFHKYSLFPLIPSAIKRKNLEVLHNSMMEQNIDYALFDSGSKVSTIVADGRTQGDKLYSNLAERKVDTETIYTKNVIYLNYLKDQLDINSEFKGKVIFSTQLRKLIEEGLIEGGVPVDYMPGKGINERRKAWASEKNKDQSDFYKLYKNYEDKIEKLVEFRKAELRNEVGWTEQEMADGKGGLEKLVQFIQKDLDRQDLADHEIDFIKVDEQGRLVHDLSISLSANKIERALNAIVNNRLIRQKVNGEALVQLAGSMLEATNPTDEERARWRTNDLLSYRKGADGNTLAMDVKVALQGNFEQLIHLRHKDGKKIAVFSKRPKETVSGQTKYIKEINEEATLARLNETIQDPEWRAVPGNLDLITMVGVRIPVQGLNSMEFMAVWEFLPKEAGNIIVPPSEMVAKSGSDFDIDKLTIMMPNTAIIGGQPEVIREVQGGKTEQDNIQRIAEIAAELKVLNQKKKEALASESEEYKALSKNISAEAMVELKALADEYYPKLRELQKAYTDAQNEITEIVSLDKQTLEQSKRLDDAWDKVLKIPSQEELLQDEYQEAKKEIKDENFQSNLALFKERQAKQSGSILAKISELTKEQKGLDSKAIENSLMFSIRDILQIPHNFVSLITPNDTSLLTGEGSIVEELSKYREYSAKNRAFGEASTTSPTRVLEPAYNIYKHESNAVGKETLGQGAVDNTYNTIFNRVGAYLNPMYTPKNGGPQRRSTILMSHNTLEVLEGPFEGETTISLSHLYDVKGENKISDVINQLMNGWVDVAKDAWIFDIQGNNQVTPVLMFLLQAGVPLHSAIYFVSNPLVKDYVKEQKIATSVFARPKGEAPEDPTFFRSAARDKVLSKIGLNGLKGLKLYKTTLKMTEGKDFTDLAHKIATTHPANALTSYDAKAAFLHYLELEELAKGVRDIKMKLNYDTTKSTTLFDAQKKEADLAQLYADSKIPDKIIEEILAESPIGSFRVAPFQLQLWGPLFKLRSSEKLNNFLIDKLSDMTQSKKMQKVYGTQERYVEEFKNDLVVKIFTDEIKAFDINSKVYKGLTTNTEASVNDVEHLNRGVVVAPNKAGEMTVYLDKSVLDIQFKRNLFAGYTQADSLVNKAANKKFNYDALGLAKVPAQAFMYTENRKSEYYRFAMEREYLRATKPFAEMSKTHYFNFKAKRNMAAIPQLKDETTEVYEARVLKTTYEEILRDTALDNIMNYWKMFMSDNTVADQLFELREMHPTLETDYSIINDLIISEGANNFTNLALRDTRVNKDYLEIYYRNIKELADVSTPSIPISETNPKASYQENDRIAQFFSNLPLVAFLQSGLNTTDSLSMGRVMPTEAIAEIISNATPTYSLESFYRQFNTHNNPKNISKRRRLKNYVSKEAKQVPNRELLNTNIEANQTFPFTYPHETFDKLINGEITANTRRLDQPVKKGDIIEFSKDFKNEFNDIIYTRSVTVRATTNSVDMSYETPAEWAKREGSTEAKFHEMFEKGFSVFEFEIIDAEEIADRPDTNILEVDPQDKNQLESLIKNNPSVIFVLEGAVKSDGYFASGIGNISSSFDNVMPITLRNILGKGKTALWDKKTTAENIQAIKESLDTLEEVYKQGASKIAFLSPSVGYGSYLVQKVGEDTNEVYDAEAFKYLSTELYNRFGYRNRYSKVVSDVQNLMQNKQEEAGVVEFQLDIPFEDMNEARERLTCKF